MHRRDLWMAAMVASLLLAGCATSTAVKPGEVELLRAQMTDLRSSVQNSEATLKALEERLNAMAAEERNSREELEQLTRLQEEIQRQLQALIAQTKGVGKPDEK